MVYKQFQYVIRLQRSGRIRRPFWRIVVQRKLYGVMRAPISILGTYDCFSGLSRFHNYSEIPEKKKRRRFHLVFVNFKLLDFWLLKGARPTSRVERILF